MVYFGSKEDFIECQVYERSSLPPGFAVPGPVIIEEPMSTTLILPENNLVVDDYGNIIIQVL